MKPVPDSGDHARGGAVTGTNDMVGRFDFVMANPPFNQKEVDHTRPVNEVGAVDARFSLGIPTVNNANYLWILFAAALNDRGRASFAMANSASDAGGSERVMRRRLTKEEKKGTPHAGKVLFIDARHIFHQVIRTHRDFTPEQIELLA
ncbi:MAG: SAM-dependent methyltransferase [Gemmatimonadota bacterium]|jgi:type I restriction enzyme M protein|nr:SAM-dependent methyltransferase [Gemmatimonadota bacterium]